MFVVQDADFDAAVNALRQAGFRDAPWSYGSLRDPQFYTDKKMQDLHRKVAKEHRNIDSNSTRFLFPSSSGIEEVTRAIMLRSSYAHLSLSDAPESSFDREGAIYYPARELLLESFAKTIVREPEKNRWTTTLETWATSYLYGQLMMRDEVLDSCPEEKVREWFDNKIRRHAGGIDRITVTKWVGKKGYNGPSCDGFIPVDERIKGVHIMGGNDELKWLEKQDPVPENISRTLCPRP
jgi:hypothetical protein